MNSFKFRYDSLLTFLEKKEEKIKERLKEVNQQLNYEKDKLNSLNIEEANYSNMIKYKLDIGCRLNHLKLIDSYKKEIMLKKNNQINKIEKLEELISTIKKDLIKASKEKRIMEKLKEKSFEEYKNELKIAEEKIVDQVVTYSNNLRR